MRSKGSRTAWSKTRLRMVTARMRLALVACQRLESPQTTLTKATTTRAQAMTSNNRR